ncbi:transcriptional regulator GlxA family with amidase domain [Catenuloplanes nepalensis]|uniref:Transcriptional regulator GlxA family with amidase domain n=1 Tax=Catenuloplanes nepalensis TaxID=587533 RepID=A0ABT9MYF3_9ACTN|nr:helix-turn-helix domain-containing protein [Catenuloplanes nepalensis]MDP9796071.1 transcriptional regulator GlxA family with amidase domain [Catenuloplanes nepalensis]
MTIRLSQVAVLVEEQASAFEVGAITEMLGPPHYDVTICAPAAGVEMRGGLLAPAAGGLDTLSGAGTVVIPDRPLTTVSAEPVTSALRAAHARGARMIAFGGGVFTLAAAGVLDGRRATTHRELAHTLQERFPGVRVEADPLFVDDGDVLTAAGSAAALDLGLHVIRTDHGAEVCCAVAKRLAFPVHRDGFQSQSVDRALPAIRDESVTPLLTWAQSRLHEPVGVAELAAAAGISVATLHRRFAAQVGVTPLAWLTRGRLLIACRLLERGETRIEVVARRSGLGTASHLRVVMRRELGLTPTEYQRRYAAVTTGR